MFPQKMLTKKCWWRTCNPKAEGSKTERSIPVSSIPLVEDLQFEESSTEDIIPKTEPEIIIPKTEPQAAIIADQTSILVADDDDVTRQIIATILGKQGYKVTVSQDGIDALLSLFWPKPTLI